MQMNQVKDFKSTELKNLQLSYHDKKKMEFLQANQIDHTFYQQQSRFGVPKPLVLHNDIGEDFIKGVMKDLTCPICQELVSSPVIYRTCLHRFCSNCIETYNRQGKKECPLCRIAIGNRRQLRPDKNIAALIGHLNSEIAKINKLDELQAIQIRSRIIEQQKK